jgi:signal transduction histidine kinase
MLAKKYGAEDFTPINTNIMRINDIVNSAYIHLHAKEETKQAITNSSIKDFLDSMDVLVDAVKLIFSVEIQNEVLDFRPPAKNIEITKSIDLILQIMENAVGNSINANATKIYVRVLQVDTNCIIELVDNGVGGKPKEESPLLQKTSLIPHGIGTKIITKNMSDMNGKAEWHSRLDNTGMILRLYFPMKTVLS